MALWVGKGCNKLGSDAAIICHELGNYILHSSPIQWLRQPSIIYTFFVSQNGCSIEWSCSRLGIQTELDASTNFPCSVTCLAIVYNEGCEIVFYQLWCDPLQLKINLHIYRQSSMVQPRSICSKKLSSLLGKALILEHSQWY